MKGIRELALDERGRKDTQVWDGEGKGFSTKWTEKMWMHSELGGKGQDDVSDSAVGGRKGGQVRPDGGGSLWKGNVEVWGPKGKETKVAKESEEDTE